jgi:hypothetical protein
VNLNAATDPFEAGGERGGEAIDSGLVVAGRFDLDQFTGGVNDFFAARGEFGDVG